MRLLRFLGFVCLVYSVECAPAFKGRDTRGRTLQDNSLVYSLFFRLMSNGDLRTWINQYVLKSFGRNGESFLGSQSINQNSGKQSLQGQRISTSLSTPKAPKEPQTTPNLTIERDYDSRVTMTTNTPPIIDLTIERDHFLQTTPSDSESTTRSTEGYTIPIIKLTGPDSQKIVDPGTTTTVNLTVIRDYPDPGPTPGIKPQAVRKKRSWPIPVVKLETKADYNRPGGVPPLASLTDEDGNPLIVVRDSSDSQNGNNDITKSTTTTASPKRYYYVLEPCSPGNTMLFCFKIKYGK